MRTWCRRQSLMLASPAARSWCGRQIPLVPAVRRQGLWTRSRVKLLLTHHINIRLSYILGHQPQQSPPCKCISLEVFLKKPNSCMSFLKGSNFPIQTRVRKVGYLGYLAEFWRKLGLLCTPWWPGETFVGTWPFVPRWPRDPGAWPQGRPRGVGGEEATLPPSRGGGPRTSTSSLCPPPPNRQLRPPKRLVRKFPYPTSHLLPNRVIEEISLLRLTRPVKDRIPLLWARAKHPVVVGVSPKRKVDTLGGLHWEATLRDHPKRPPLREVTMEETTLDSGLPQGGLGGVPKIN
jgi:hypothetical protein